MNHLFRAEKIGPPLAIFVVIVWIAGLKVGFTTSLALLYATGTLAVALGLFFPSLGLLGLAMAIPLDSVARHYVLTGGLLRFNTLNYLLLGTVLLSLNTVLRFHDVHTRIFELLLLLLAVQLFFSQGQENGLQHLINAASSIALLLYFVRAQRDPQIWHWLTIIASLIAAFGGASYYLESSLRPMNHNAWSLYPLSGIFATVLGFHTAKTTKQRASLLVLTTVNLLWVFLSGSRGAMITAVTCMLFILVFMGRGPERTIFVAVGVFVVLIFGAVFQKQMAQSLYRVNVMFDENRSFNSRTSGRSDLIKAGWDIFLEHPLGVGTGGFARTFEALDRDDLAFRGRAAQAHSGWIKTLAENGVPGIVLLVLYVGSFTYIGWQKRASGLLALGALTTFSLSVAFLSNEFQGKGFWMLATGTIALLHYQPRRRIMVRRQVVSPTDAAPQPMMVENLA